MDKMLSALAHIKVADLSREDWLKVGMALKQEGCSVSVWDDWSKNDHRYHDGECQRLWNGFNGSSKPVTGGTIIQMAKDSGWSPELDVRPLDWDDYIEYDGVITPDEWHPGEELSRYLRTLFEPDDYVGICTESWEREGKYLPTKGNYRMTCKEILAGIEKYGDDLGAVIGDYNPKAGAWIRFNPLDGKGIKDENVTRYKYALVECDEGELSEQEYIYRSLRLPIACLVSSGNKSVHAIVKVDAEDLEEYKKRVVYLYDYLKKKDVKVDKQNSNPSRLSRMPGVKRGANKQFLIATNIGCRNWEEWLDFAEGVGDDLPPIISLDEYLSDPPAVPEPIIEGVLRQGHKMLIAGPSKAGKSFLLMELAAAFAEGGKWLGFRCKQGKVLYLNMEIDPASFGARFMTIYDALSIEHKHLKNIYVWNLRGRAVPLDELAPKIIRRAKDKGYIAVIIDPIYKVLTGDENSAADMGRFCNQFDRICSETGVSVIYCHHHSKGANGNMLAMNRASGSGVFARDPDAQLDMIELELPEFMQDETRTTAWRIEPILREFKSFGHRDVWFDYPLHILDERGDLENLAPGGMKNRKTVKQINFEFDEFESVYESTDRLTVRKAAEMLGINEKTVRRRVNKYPGYKIVDSVILKEV